MAYARPVDRKTGRHLDDLDEFALLLFRQSDVISRSQVLRYLSTKTLQHRLEAGWWQFAHRSVYLARSGPLSDEQRRWVAVLATAGVLGGLSALAVLGLRGHHSRQVHVVLPARRQDHDPPTLTVVHRTRHLPTSDIHLAGLPPCTMPARSLVDAAQWARTDDDARAVIAAGFQQRLVGGTEVHEVLERMPRARRRSLINETASDASGGTHSIPEAALLRLCRQHQLPAPTRPVRRRDAAGRQRYLDAYFELWGVHVEIDGSHHLEVRSWWAEMKRQNDLWVQGDRVLRFPAWVVRHRPGEVVTQLRAALTAAGWSPPSHQHP